MIPVKANAQKMPMGAVKAPKAVCHDRPASAKGTEFSVRMHDGKGMCK